MGDKLLKKITTPYIIGALIAFATLIVVFTVIDWRWGIATLGLGLLLGAYAMFIFRNQRMWIQDYLEGVEDEIEETLRYSVKHHPLPLCVVDSSGKIAMTNEKFKEIFPDTQILKTEIFDLTGRKQDEFMPEEGETSIRLKTEGKEFLLLSSYLNKDVSKSVIIYFMDITDYEKLKRTYEDEKKCYAYIIVDNYDELISRSPDDRKSLIAASIEAAIRQWASTIEASIQRYKNDRYMLVFENKHYKKIIENKFSVLDDVRKIETDADFPVSLSIGVGLGGKTPQQSTEYAAFSLDLALGRGGDQAVVKRGSEIRYYGGKVQVRENRNKGKSRVMSHALRRLMKQSSKIMIMGHRNPDMDSFGAAIGVHRFAFNNKMDALIVVNEYNHSLKDVYEKAEKSGSYKFLKNDEALEEVDKDTLLVIVDTHITHLVECKELIGKTDRMVLIDHHRKMEGFIDTATLTYMEPTASSTSELITEILQYDETGGNINKLEAELLLTGIYVDTNGFSVNTGTRTFEAASWLRENGADSSSVRQYLQTDMEDFKQRASIISNAEFLSDGIAISRSEGRHSNAQIINAQAADELLDIKGIRASFVVGETDKEVVVSARSLGDINVQTIMERLGGGGHLTMAAAQLNNKTVDEVIIKIKKYIREIEGGKKS